MTQQQTTYEDEQFWQQHVNRFSILKLSKVKYCKQNNLVYHRFLYWFDKLKANCGREPQKSPLNLVPVTLADDTPEEPGQPSVVANNTNDSNSLIDQPPIAILTWPNGVTLALNRSTMLVRVIREMNR